MQKVAVDRYVIETLMRDLVSHDKKPSAFVVYLYLWQRTHGESRASVHQSHQQLADATGLSKSAVQSAVKLLRRRKLVEARRPSPTATPEYRVHRPWLER
jgi:DNA-binding transcriptional ArsR family regulator